jgi:hypothetical protein
VREAVQHPIPRVLRTQCKVVSLYLRTNELGGQLSGCGTDRFAVYNGDGSYNHVSSSCAVQGYVVLIRVTEMLVYAVWKELRVWF